MSTADIVILLIAALGAYSGYKEGFLMELFSVVAIVLGIFGGFKLMGEGMILLQGRFNADTEYLPYISFIVIFIVIVIVVNLLGKLIRHSMDKSFLGRVDQWMGLSLGVFKTLFMMSVAIWLMDSLKFSLKDEWTAGSWLYPFTATLAPKLASWAGNLVPFFKEIFRQF